MRAHKIEDGEHLDTCWCHYEQKLAMSDHAAVKEEHRELLIKVIAAIDCNAYGDARQLLADFARDARVKEAEWCLALIRSHEEEYLSKLQQRIAQLKRGEA